MTSVDTTAFDHLKRDARRGAATALAEVRNRAEELLRAEAPGGAEGQLGKGVTHEDDLAGPVLSSSLIVSAVNPNAGGAAILHLPSGATREISLRGGEPFDFARAVAEGTGLFGPRHQEIGPTRGRALLIGVDAIPAGEVWISGPEGKFIIRRKSEGMHPNDYGGRAADRLEGEVQEIVALALAGAGVTV